MKNLALKSGPKTVKSDVGDMFTWPIINQEMENAVLDVLHKRNMSGLDITKQFEQKFADWHNIGFGLGYNSGTSAVHGALYALGVRKGDEIISPSMTYWASCLQAFSLGATVRFVDIDKESFCIDPEHIENNINERTKAIVVVHFAGRVANMDRIMDIARKHDIKVLEDFSHAQGALYKGKMVGTIGDVGACSLMTGKSFAIGEAGMLITDNRNIYEHALAFGHHARHNDLTDDELRKAAGLPLGGYKHRMHQMSAAVGLEQLKKFPAEMAEIDKAMNYFCDAIDQMPGLKANRPDKKSNSTNGAWYVSRCHYNPDELGGLSITHFCEAVRAEGVNISNGVYGGLHLHPIFNSVDIYGDGKPTIITNLPEGIEIRCQRGDLPVTESIKELSFALPWFKHFRKDIIDEYIAAFAKVTSNYQQLLDSDTGNTNTEIQWGLSPLKK